MDEMKRLSSCSSAPYSSLSSSTCFRSMVGPRPRMAGALPNTLCSLLLLRDFSSLVDAELLLWHFLARSTHCGAVAHTSRLGTRFARAPRHPGGVLRRSGRPPIGQARPSRQDHQHHLALRTGACATTLSPRLCSLHPSRVHLFAPARTWCSHVQLWEREASILKNEMLPQPR